MKPFCLHNDTLNAFRGLCDELVATGNRFRVTIIEWKDSRSISQNRLMWKWLKEIEKSVQVGDQYYDDEMWHAYFKKWYCPTKIILLPVGTDSIKSTKLLDVGEFHFYLNRIELWAMDKDITLTTPDDCEYRKLQQEQEK